MIVQLRGSFRFDRTDDSGDVTRSAGLHGRMSFRVCCGHCRSVVLDDLERLTDAESEVLVEHLRTRHPSIAPKENAALGDLLQHFDFQSDAAT